ncbi:transposable element Tcb1 transposase [Trichonephila clavipes]|nr:transposable element Tcb1 transposase [Trichonephila clavipes]
MTGYIYRDVILEQHVRLFLGAMGAEFLLMDDNARPHRENILDECLQSEDITRMVGHQKEGVCVHPKYKRDGENHMQSDSDSTMCAKNSDILLAENSLIMDTEISISDEGSHAGEKEQYLNASLSKLQMFPSTSTFVLVRKVHMF